ncbi:hypothetical protein [Kushneria indalinina]|nr:hypothetical protein [Kushneria indalinina]
MAMFVVGGLMLMSGVLMVAISRAPRPGGGTHLSHAGAHAH